MKIPNKRYLQQIAIDLLSGIDFRFYKVYKQCYAETYSFLVSDTILPSNNLGFRRNLLESMYNNLDNQ